MGDRPGGAKRTFLGLDVMRGCAALAVVCYHEHDIFDAPWLMPSGFLAVDLFFAMSGFVIAHAYDSRIPALGLSGFVRLRAIRFYPLYLLGLGLGVLRFVILSRLGADVFDNSWFVTALIAALIFFPAPAPTVDAGISPLNGPAWSLILEMWINAAYALLFRFLTTRALLLTVLLSGIFLAVFAIKGEIDGGPHWNDLPVGIARVFYSFPLGVLLYRHSEKMPDLRRFGLVLIPLAFALFMVPVSSFYSLLFITILSPLIVIIGCQASYDRRISEYLGNSSYCIYVIHAPLLLLASGAAHRLGYSDKLFVLFIDLSMLLAAPILHRCYDLPLRRSLMAMTSPRRAATVEKGP